MNLGEFAASNGDFIWNGSVSNAKSRIDTAQDVYDRALQTNAWSFVHDVTNGRHDQIARVVGGHKLTLANELLDKIDSPVLFELIQRAMRGESVQEMAIDLVNKAAQTFAEAITEWTE